MRHVRLAEQQNLWNRANGILKNSWKPGNTSHFSRSVRDQRIPHRSVATHVETNVSTEGDTDLYNAPGYHCTACNYTSKMPIFICNSCHALDPQGGSMGSNGASEAPELHYTAGEALGRHQANFVPKSKKCTHQESLPCDVCDPVASNAHLAPADKLKAPSAEHKCDYFQFFACPHKFNMDDAQLKQMTNRYRELQRVLHPDVYSAKSDTTAADILDVQQQSAALSDVYRTLRNPYQRAIYLLRLHGIDIERLSETQYRNMLGATDEKISHLNLDQLKAQEQAMLFHVMEVRETLEESNDTAEIKDILTSASSQITECLKAMELAFEKRDLFDARHRTILLNYLSKIQQEAETKLEALEKT
jgi:molecular chaperone HscB